MGFSATPLPAHAVSPPPPRKKPFYSNLWVQVLLAVGAAIVFGYFSPTRAIAMKPLGDAFIKLITMIVAPDCLLHRGLRYRRNAGYEENRPGRRQGSAVL